MVGTQHFNLRWNNHTSNILQIFHEHLSSESLVDVTLSSEGKFIKAHKIILSACSPYFQEVFAKYTDKQALIILNGIRFEDLQLMIKFMYNGEIRVQETELETLLAAAETLQVKGLSNVRTKYERGEITSVTPEAQKITSRISESPALTKESSAVDSIKAKDVLVAPIAAPIHPPNSVLPAVSVVTPPSAVGARSKPVSGNVAPRLSANVSKLSGKTINIAPRPPQAPVPALAIATILPAAPSKMIPAASNASSVRAVVPILPRPATSSSSMNSKTGKFGKSGKFKKLRATNSTTTSSSVIPITFTTSLIEPTTIGSTHSTVKSADSISNASTDSTSGETNFLQYQNNCNPVTEISRVSIDPTPPSGTIAKIDDETTKKPAAAEVPRVRKRRKMSHTVNELARETVFTINGRVLLETDLATFETGNKNSIAVRTDLTDSGTIEEITPRKLRIKIQSKHPQESLLIKDKAKGKEPTKIPRPLNAFMIFANEWRRKLAAENPTESNTTISVRLGKMWKSLSVDSKETYYRQAQIADEIHHQKYPGYYYSPREARLKKNLKQDKTSTKCSAMSPKPSSDSQNLDEATINKAYANVEKQTNDAEIYTSESDGKYSDDEDDYKEQENYYDDEEDDDVILEYSADEDEPEEKPDLTMLTATTRNSPEIIEFKKL